MKICILGVREITYMRCAAALYMTIVQASLSKPLGEVAMNWSSCAGRQKFKAHNAYSHGNQDRRRRICPNGRIWIRRRRVPVYRGEREGYWYKFIEQFHHVEWCRIDFLVLRTLYTFQLPGSCNSANGTGSRYDESRASEGPEGADSMCC